MANKFKLTIVSPDGKKIVTEATILNIVTTDGALGILANHLPLVSIVDISHFNYRNENGTFDYAISGGVLNVKKDEVIILAESFESKDEIDRSRAEAAKLRAEDRLSNSRDDEELDVKRAEMALKRALNRLSL